MPSAVTTDARGLKPVASAPDPVDRSSRFQVVLPKAMTAWVTRPEVRRQARHCHEEVGIPGNVPCYWDYESCWWDAPLVGVSLRVRECSVSHFTAQPREGRPTIP